MSRKDDSCLACGGSGRIRPGEPKGTCFVCSAVPPPHLALALAEARSRASPTLGEALAMAAARAEGREEAAPAREKPRKYRNEPCEADGIRFDSRKEADRYFELRAMERAGLISGLVLQPPFDLYVNGHRVCRYVGDFLYFLPDGTRVVEDAKSPATRRNRAYRIKRKLMKAVHGIDVREV